jgi:two-component system chemotaxis response regulator CheB
VKSKSSVIRVLVVDDSPLILEMMRRTIDRTPDMLVVGTAQNAEEACRAVQRLKPDLVTMDVTMPGDGIVATREIMRMQPTPIAIVTARPVGPDSETSFQALAAGAVEVLTKPRAEQLGADAELTAAFLRDLRNIAAVGVVGIRRRPSSDRSELRPTPVAQPDEVREEPGEELAVIGVGASTGGPPAIRELLSRLRGEELPPIVVVQHMSPHFVEGFARWLGGCIELPVKLPREGSPLTRGTVFVATADRHLTVDAELRLHLSNAPAVHGHRPAVDPLFYSLAQLGPRALGVLLTGMGEDGARGLSAMREAGAITIAQDEASCLVYGMPRAAASLDAASLIANPTHIGRLLSRPGALALGMRGPRRTARKQP